MIAELVQVKARSILVGDDRLQIGVALFSMLTALKRFVIPIFFALSFCLSSTKADDGGFWGTVLDNLAATYVVQMDDGRLLDVEWNSGYDD